MLTCGGLDAAQTISSAMSSPVTKEIVRTEYRVVGAVRTGLETSVYVLGGLSVPVEADKGELGLDHARLDFGHANRCVN